MFRKRFRLGSGSRPAAPGPREVPVAEPAQAAPRDPAPSAGAPTGAPSADGLASAPGHTLVVGRDIAHASPLPAPIKRRTAWCAARR